MIFIFFPKHQFSFRNTKIKFKLNRCSTNKMFTTYAFLELLFLPILFLTIIAFSLNTVIGFFWLITLGVMALCFWSSLAIMLCSWAQHPSSTTPLPPSPPSSVENEPPSYTVVMEAEEGLPSYAQVMGEVEEVDEKVVKRVEFLKSSSGSPSPDTA